MRLSGGVRRFDSASRTAENKRWPLTQAITSSETSRNGLPKVASAGVLTGVLTPLLPPLVDKISGSPGDFRIALVAIPFAILVLILVWRLSSNPWWAALMAAIVTMIAFVRGECGDLDRRAGR